jgi:outer membrane usher protein
LRFAGYRYSTVGYRDFDEAVRERSHDRGFRGSRRSRLEAAMFQNFGPSTSVSLTLSQEDFWNTTYQQRQFQFNLTRQHRGVSYNLFASQSLSDERTDHDRQFGISISLPLDLGHSNSATLNYLNSGGRLSQNARLTGSVDQNRLSYSAGLSNDDQRRQTASLSAAYQAPFASIGAGLSQGSDYRSVSLNASGAVLLHAGGVELGPYLSETSALVHVPDIAGVGLSNAAGAKTNARGYALLPHLRPYRVNHMALKTDDLGPDVEIDNGAAQVVPRRGAIVKATFEARRVTRIVLSVTAPQGSPVPFGAQVKDAQGIVLGIAGQGGQILLATENKPQTLEVRWGERPGQRCELDLNPETMERKQGYHLQSLTCRP